MDDAVIRAAIERAEELAELAQCAAPASLTALVLTDAAEAAQRELLRWLS